MCRKETRNAFLLKRRVYKLETCPVYSFNWNYDIYVLAEEVYKAAKFSNVAA